jgi:cytoplasmic iron level regulating protein YaaA (DUF328/UPF0246 family)
VPILLLLPPSEGKAPGGATRPGPDRFAPDLDPERAAIRSALTSVTARLTREELSALFRVRGPLLDRAIDATRALLEGDAPLLPAWKRYTGVVWSHLDPGSLPGPARSRIFVPSALYGITAAEDGIAEYRLGMSANLPGLGNLARYWRAPVAKALAARRGRSTVVDLLPGEHRGAIDWGRLAPVVSVAFLAADGRRAAGHVAKAVKGRFARHLLEHGTADALGFSFDGWSIRRTESGFALSSVR